MCGTLLYVEFFIRRYLMKLKFKNKQISLDLNINIKELIVLSILAIIVIVLIYQGYLNELLSMFFFWS
jgi:hypothetical protein